MRSFEGGYPCSGHPLHIVESEWELPVRQVEVTTHYSSVGSVSGGNTRRSVPTNKMSVFEGMSTSNF